MKTMKIILEELVKCKQNSAMITDYIKIYYCIMWFCVFKKTKKRLIMYKS